MGLLNVLQLLFLKTARSAIALKGALGNPGPVVLLSPDGGAGGRFCYKLRDKCPGRLEPKGPGAHEC